MTPKSEGHGVKVQCLTGACQEPGKEGGGITQCRPTDQQSPAQPFASAESKTCDSNKYCSGTPCGFPLWRFPSLWPEGDKEQVGRQTDKLAKC